MSALKNFRNDLNLELRLNDDHVFSTSLRQFFLKGLAPAYLSDVCVGTAAVVMVSRAGLRSATRGNLVVLRHRTEWGSRSFAVADQNI